VIVPFYKLRGVQNRSINNSIKKWTKLKRKELETISKRFNPKYILGLINSKFAKFYLNTIRRHSTEFYFYPDDLKRLPILNLSSEEQKPIVEKVNLRLDIAKEFGSKKENFLNRLHRNFDLKGMDKKLEKIYDLNFETFFKELKKRKIELSPEQEEKEAEYYEKRREELSELIKKMETTDREIDKMIFDLYKINEEERLRIEYKMREYSRNK